MRGQKGHFLACKCLLEPSSPLVLPCRRFCSAKEDAQPADTRLYLYSKEGCHLCDGLKVALQPWSHALSMVCIFGAGA